LEIDVDQFVDYKLKNDVPVVAGERQHATLAGVTIRLIEDPEIV
jgi:hypothetical protein